MCAALRHCSRAHVFIINDVIAVGSVELEALWGVSRQQAMVDTSMNPLPGWKITSVAPVRGRDSVREKEGSTYQQSPGGHLRCTWTHARMHARLRVRTHTYTACMHACFHPLTCFSLHSRYASVFAWVSLLPASAEESSIELKKANF